MTKDELCYALTRFVLEVRKKNGDEYPSETLYELVISLQLYLATKGAQVKFLTDEAFISLQNTLDTQMKVLASQGKRAPRRKAGVISYEDEDKMWTSGVLGISTPDQLLDTLVYLIGLHFALRAGKEHHDLRYVNSQLTLMTAPNGRRFLRYKEDASKNCHGGLKHRRVEAKTVDAYENTKNPERCIIRIYEEYISHRPVSDKCSPALYLRPLKDTKKKTWYSCQAWGIHQITRTVTRLCKKAGVEGYKTNHSLRATAATRMYQQNVDEQHICETTGHRSSSVRSYKRTSDNQRAHKSDILYNPPSVIGPESEPSTSSVAIKGDKAIQITVNVNLDNK